MRIEKYINIEQEVEIDLTSEDIQMVFSEGDSVPHILLELNQVAGFLRGISDGKINEMVESSKMVICEFLTEQAKRYSHGKKKENEMDNDKVSEAFEIIKQAMIKDNPSERGSLAHSWHCNIAMMCSDAIGTDKAASRLTFEDAHRIGNEAASRFMKLCFDVETNA